MSTHEVDDWTLLARCRGMEDALFPDSRDQKRIRDICHDCPVRVDCLAEALDNRIEWGVWGGLTERERRALLRQRPDVKNWQTVLEKNETSSRKEAERRRREVHLLGAEQVPPVADTV